MLWLEINATHGSLAEPPFAGQDEVVGNALDLRQVASFHTIKVCEVALLVPLGALFTDVGEVGADHGALGKRAGVVGVVKKELTLVPEVNLRGLVRHLETAALDAPGFGLNLGLTWALSVGSLQTLLL